MSSSTPTPQSVINDLNTVAKDQTADLAEIKKAVERHEVERRSRIEKSLQGVADLAVLAGTKGRRFVVAYWKDGEAKTAEGIEYPVQRDEGGDPISISVRLRDEDHPFWGRYVTMAKFRESLNADSMPHTIAYFDK